MCDPCPSRIAATTAVPLPTSLYVHVPFCRHRCAYCNFALVAGRDYLIESYLVALTQEIDLIRDRFPVGEPLQTLFIGGGTPSHLPLDQLARLLEAIADRFPLPADAEVTMEMNPNDVTPRLVDQLARWGVNRISLGVQSFDDDKLQRLDRQHTGDDGRRAIQICRDRFPSLSLDLMFGIGECLEVWHRDLDTAVAAGVDHLSTYELTIEKGTAFWSRARRQPDWPIDEETRMAMYRAAQERLSQAGWQHYEISNYARSGHRSRHNQAYWNGNRFLAFGPGAASFVGHQRWINHASTASYIRRVSRGELPWTSHDRLTPRQLAAELLAFGIRQLDGVDLEMVEAQTGFQLADLWSPEQSHCDQWVQIERGRLRLTTAGILFADAVGCELLQSGDVRA